MGRGKSNKNGQGWQDRQWTKESGGSYNGWRQQPSSSSQQWDWSQSRWEAEETEPYFPTYSMMTAEPSRTTRSDPTEAEQNKGSRRIELAKGFQKMVTATRRAEVRLRKAEEEIEFTKRRWQKFQDRLQQSFIQERTRFKTDMSRLEQEVEQQKTLQKEALLELQAAIAHPEKMLQKIQQQEPIPENVQEEWDQLIVECEQRPDEEMAEVLAEKLGRQLQDLLGVPTTPPRRTSEGATPRTQPRPTAAATRGRSSLERFIEQAVQKAKETKEEVVATYNNMEPMEATRDPYITSPTLDTGKPSPSLARTKPKSPAPRLGLKMRGRKPVPTPKTGTPLAAKLDRVRAKATLRMVTPEMETIDTDDEDEVLSALPGNRGTDEDHGGGSGEAVG